MGSRLIATLVAWLVGLLGLASPAVAATQDAPVPAYACNAPAPSTEAAGVATELGPPEARPGSSTHRADGHEPLGALTRSDVVETPATYSYDDPQQFVQNARRSQVVERPGGDCWAEHACLSTSSVAAS